MATYRVSLGALPTLVKQVQKQRFNQAVEAIRVTCATWGERIVQEEIDATKPVPVDRGTYRRSWKTANVKDGARLYNPLAYAAVIEHGRRPGARMPPPKLIAEWARRKGLLDSVPKSERKAAMKGLGFVIARAISKRGQPAKNVLKRTIKRLLPEVKKAVKLALSV